MTYDTTAHGPAPVVLVVGGRVSCDRPRRSQRSR